MGQSSGHRLPLLWCDSSLRWNDHIKRDPDGPVTRVDLCCALAACHGLVVNSTPQKYTGEVHFSAFSCVWRFKKRFFVILFCSDFHLQDREVHVRLAERTRSWVGEMLPGIAVDGPQRCAGCLCPCQRGHLQKYAAEQLKGVQTQIPYTSTEWTAEEDSKEAMSKTRDQERSEKRLCLLRCAVEYQQMQKANLFWVQPGNMQE